MTKKTIVIGTRGSRLALWQAHFTKNKLEQLGYPVRLNIIQTSGDRSQEWNLSFDKIEGKGFFTKELEDALLEGSADLAVHSCKDMPTENAEGLAIKAYSYRANPSDILLIHPDAYDAKEMIPVRKDAVVGTSSARRKSQILAHRRDVEVKDLRGNVPTRINKLREGQYDAIILASAGIERLELDVSDLKTFELKPSLFIPAPAQGVLAYQIRENDPEMEEVCRLLHDSDSFASIDLERSVLKEFNGGCQIPLGVYACSENKTTHLWIAKADAWNQPLKRIYAQFNNTPPPAKEIVHAFQNIRPQSVFISRELEDDSYFYHTLTQSDFTVHGENLLDIHGVDFEWDGSGDWLFFTSRNGVKYFFGKHQISKINSPKIGAVNSGTAQVIQSLGYSVEYVGNAANTENTAQEFSKIAKGRVVLPQAVHSKGVMEKYLSDRDVISLPVYNNQILENVRERNEDILVFTSPMNVDSYFQKHQLKDFQLLIAIGPSTQKAIESYGHSCNMPYGPMPWDLVDVVMWTAASSLK